VRYDKYLMRIFLLSFILFLNFHCDAQGFRTRYVVNSSIYNYSTCIYETLPYTYFGSGFIYDTTSGAGVNKLAILGLDSIGQVTWVKKYGDENCQFLYSGFNSRSFYRYNNYFYYAGTVKDSTNQIKGILIKFDFNGDILWQQLYSDPDRDVAPQIVTRSIDGGFLLTGFFQDWTLHTRPALLIKTDHNGNELWRKVLNKADPNVQDGRGIGQDSVSGKIIIVGHQYNSYNNPVFNQLVLDSLGNFVFQHDFNILGVLQDIIRTKDGKYIAVGCSSNGEKYYSYIFKFDINAPSVPIWRHDKFGTFAYQNMFQCLTEMPNGDILVAGQFDSLLIQNQKTNIWTRITRFDANGVLKSNRYYDYAPPDYQLNVQKMVSIELTSDGGWVGAIACSAGINSLFFVKYDSTGCDSSVAYCLNPTAIASNDIDDSFFIYPNPASDFLNIKVNTNKSDHQVQIFNSTGQLMRKENIIPDPRNPTPVILTDLPPGIYFIQLTNSESEIKTSRFVISR
jgi:hypothetical protein